MRAPFRITWDRIQFFVVVPACILHIICTLSSGCICISASCSSNSKHMLHKGMTFGEIQERWLILDGIENVELKLMKLDLMKQRPPSPFTREIFAAQSKLEISHMKNLEYIRNLKMALGNIIDQKYESRGYENQQSPARLRALEEILKTKKSEVWTYEMMAPIIEGLNMKYKTELFDLSEALQLKSKSVRVVAAAFIAAEFAAAESAKSKIAVVEEDFKPAKEYRPVPISGQANFDLGFDITH